VRWLGLRQTRLEKFLSTNRRTKRYMKMALGWRAQRAFGKAAKQPTWQAVWSAGQTVELVSRVEPAAKIVETMVSGYWQLQKPGAAKRRERGAASRGRRK
jgi:NAD(P)H-dependent flavin oxidoreductase YrpB (nitropropane dioxygenase family)